MFNYTGALFAYDEIFEKLGVFPLLYREVKLVLEECFREHFFFDARAQQAVARCCVRPGAPASPRF